MVRRYEPHALPRNPRTRKLIALGGRIAHVNIDVVGEPEVDQMAAYYGVEFQ